MQFHRVATLKYAETAELNWERDFSLLHSAEGGERELQNQPEKNKNKFLERQLWSPIKTRESVFNQ